MIVRDASVQMQHGTGEEENTMTDAPERPSGEAYTHGYEEHVRRTLGQRTAAVDAAFLLPHLRPGLRLLDFGCGPGSITVGLAAAVAPGEVVGVDIGPTQIEAARALAAEHGAANARFEVGSVYALPFPDASFDAAFACTVLEHLADPLAALREVRRVLRPGGVIGLRDGDWGGRVIAPPSPLVEEGLALYARLWVLNGGNPNRGREHRALLRAAGFGRIAASAATQACGTPEETRSLAALFHAQLARPEYVRRVVALGWADRERLAQLAAAQQAWGEHPDAFSASLLCQAVAWAD
jgi:ubiquinone/menaquinone biosynthesis C-methylase UbiE